MYGAEVTFSRFPALMDPRITLMGSWLVPVSTARRWTTPDRWPHRDMWLWDTVFHSAGWRHLDITLAREMILAMLDVQKEDGFVPIQSSPMKGRCAPEVSPYHQALFDYGWTATLYVDWMLNE